jgi:hypothetical protein
VLDVQFERTQHYIEWSPEEPGILLGPLGATNAVEIQEAAAAYRNVPLTSVTIR